ncbi:hypothetical protein [Gallaecimonas pentaromativorans]|uniref:hypothetical protein n=1 Tax=Gallaecimonas pentaromativorans TaxID=584787 RepID=UPI003A93638A
MNAIKFILITMAFVCAASCSAGEIHFGDYGRVYINGKEYRSGLTAIYSAFSFSDRFFVSGLIDKKGSDSYFIKEINPENGSSVSWPQENKVSQFYELENKLYAVRDEREILKLEDNQWILEKEIKPRSYVIQPKPLIACTWGQDTLDSRHRLDPVCYSPDLGWQKDVFWTSTAVEPQICHGQLKVLVSYHRQHALHWEILVMNPESGEEIGHIPASEPMLGMDVCNYELEK